MVDKNDLRLTNQIKYLKGVNLQYTEFHSKPNWDHEHCVFCCEKFMEGTSRISGYCTDDQRYWICDECFNDLNEMFKWNLISSNDTG